MSDNYEDMGANPLHLQLMMESQDGPNSDAQAASISNPPIDVSEPVIPSEDPASATTDHHPAPGTSNKKTQPCDNSGKITDIKQCWGNLKFSIIEGRLSSTSQRFSKEASDCVLAIIDYFSARFEEINQTARSIPVRTKQQDEDNFQNLEFLKTLAKRLDSIPTELKIHIPELKPLREQILDVLYEDLMTVQSLCLNRMDMMKKSAKIYRKAIDQLKRGKKTRQSEMFISGERPLPDHLLQIDPGQSLDDSLERPRSLDVGQKDVNVTFVKSPPPIRSLEDTDKGREDGVQDVEMSNLSVHDRAYLSPIPEEVLPVSQRKLIDQIEQILNDGGPRPIPDVDTALSLLNDKFGLDLSSKDPDVLETVNELHHKSWYKLIHQVEQIVNEGEVCPIHDVDTALSLLNEKLGLSLTSEDPGLLETVDDLYHKKIFFESILAGQGERHSQADGTEVGEEEASEADSSQYLQAPIIEGKASPSVEEDKKKNVILSESAESIFSPTRENKELNKTVYFTAEGPSDRTMATDEFDQTPKRMTEVPRKPLKI